jgi:hypothetical protein
MSEGEPEPEPTPAPRPSLKERLVIRHTEFAQWFDALLLRSKPYLLYRWLAFLALAVPFVLRMFFGRRFYTIGYIAGLYFVNCAVLLISPKLDPDQYPREALPAAGDGAPRPFVGKLPEFRFWRRSLAAVTIAHIATLFPFLDPPVYGPLLFVYFVLVTLFNFRERINHMIQHKYVPFDTRKAKGDEGLQQG